MCDRTFLVILDLNVGHAGIGRELGFGLNDRANFRLVDDPPVIVVLVCLRSGRADETQRKTQSGQRFHWETVAQAKNSAFSR